MKSKKLSQHKHDLQRVNSEERRVGVLELRDQNKQLRKHVYQLRNLIKVSLEVNSILDEDALIHSYIMNLFGLLTIKSVVVLTSDSKYPADFTPAQFRGITKREARELKLVSSDAFLELFLHRPFLSLQNSDDRAVSSRFIQSVARTGGEIIAPILHGHKMLGLVVIGAKHSNQIFTDSETEIIVGLSNFLATGLWNARLYKLKERMSLTDPLTGLYNRRHLEDSLKKEISRARRFHHPLSLVMLDVDDFKNYNDRLGHPSGDLLLKHLANVLAGTVRRSDTVARYGGEEFCIILPELAAAEARRFSERIRKVISSHPFEQRDVQPKGNITISLGTATFPNDASYMKDLIIKADTALYEAKENGRNRVAVFGQITRRELTGPQRQPN